MRYSVSSRGVRGTGAMEAAVTDEKSVLVIGLDPTLIDFSQPGYPPGMDSTKVLARIIHDGLVPSEFGA